MRETIIKLLLLGVCATLPIADSKLRSRMTYHWGRVPSESCPFSSGCGGGPTSEAIKKSNRWLGINLSWSALERWAGDNPEPFLSSPRRVRPVPPEGWFLWWRASGVTTCNNDMIAYLNLFLYILLIHFNHHPRFNVLQVWLSAYLEVL